LVVRGLIERDRAGTHFILSNQGRAVLDTMLSGKTMTGVASGARSGSGARARGSGRIHRTLPTTPAMAAEVTERLWEMGDIVDVLEGWEAI
jgi:hypothetical protein